MVLDSDNWKISLAFVSKVKGMYYELAMCIRLWHLATQCFNILLIAVYISLTVAMIKKLKKKNK